MWVPWLPHYRTVGSASTEDPSYTRSNIVLVVYVLYGNMVIVL